MNSNLLEKDNFRKLYVLALVVLVTVLFFNMIGAFVITLLLAAVFSGMVYPLFRLLASRLGGRRTLASILTLLVILLVVVLPLIGLMGIVVGQAIHITDLLRPWVEQQVGSGADLRLPQWFPFIDYIEPYREQIIAKAGQLAAGIGKLMIASLSKATQGTVMFFLHLFIMLYAMFFFLVGGPGIARTLFGYAPISRKNKELIFEKGVSITRATLKGTFIIGALQGLLAGAAFAVAGIEGAAFWGTIMAVLSVIPGIGAALVWIPAVIYLMVTGRYKNARLADIDQHPGRAGHVWRCRHSDRAGGRRPVHDSLGYFCHRFPR
jgi:predicted PurR-regulated permease PerM